MSLLFSKATLGKLTLQNHMVMAPLTRSRATGNVPNDLMAEYYAQRASAGLIITEGTWAPSAGYIWIYKDQIARGRVDVDLFSGLSEVGGAQFPLAAQDAQRAGLQTQARTCDYANHGRLPWGALVKASLQETPPTEREIV